jgi:hypothetical protein
MLQPATWDATHIPIYRAYEDMLQLARLQTGGYPANTNVLGMDPGHPMLRWTLWYCLVYMASRRPTTAHIQFLHIPDTELYWGQEDKLFDYHYYPSSFERRGLRTVARMRRHFEALWAEWFKAGRSWTTWLYAGLTEDAETNWQRLTDKALAIWGNGRWAAFNLVELLVNVCDAPARCGQLSYTGCTGPRQALEMLYPAVDSTTFEWQARQVGEYFAGDGIPLPLNETETMLCEYHSMARGLHYVGHFPDELQEQLHKAEMTNPEDMSSLKLIWDSRAACLPHRYLGEFGGWQGVDRARLKQYQRTGTIPDRT